MHRVPEPLGAVPGRRSAIGYSEPFWPFLGAGGIAGGIGLGLARIGRPSPGPIGFREGYLVVSLTWLLAACYAALPYLLSDEPQLSRPVDALFEGMSGFTTTGASVVDGRRGARPLAAPVAPVEPVARRAGDHRARARRPATAPDRGPADVRVGAAGARGEPARRADPRHGAQALAALHRAHLRALRLAARDRPVGHRCRYGAVRRARLLAEHTVARRVRPRQSLPRALRPAHAMGRCRLHGARGAELRPPLPRHRSS